MDAEKVFDDVNWIFISETMERLGLREKFVLAIKGIYKEQQVRLIVNNDLSKKLSVKRGTPQGCPLSLFLFILVLQVLLNQVRAEVRIKGIKHRNYEYKIRAYAGDILFVGEDPLNSYQPLIQKNKKMKNWPDFI